MCPRLDEDNGITKSIISLLTNFQETVLFRRIDSTTLYHQTDTTLVNVRSILRRNMLP